MAEYKQRQCPECGERLSIEARRCVCGWGAKTGSKDNPSYDHSCRWQYGSLNCNYPVGMFEQGQYRGLCLMHRFQDKGVQAAEIAKESKTATREDYLRVLAATIYGRGDNPYVSRLRASLRPMKPGNIGVLAKWMAPVREPGADEVEA